MASKATGVLKGIAGASGIVAGVLAYNGLLQFAKMDPLARYRDHAFEHDRNQPAITMSNVVLRQFHGPKELAEANIANVQVTQDRQVATLTGLNNGRYFSQNGEVVKFQADKGTWNQLGRVFAASGNVLLANAKLDLRASDVTYEGLREVVSVPGKIMGKLGGGEVVATGFHYHVPTGDYQIGPFTWQGVLAFDEPAKTRSRWKIKGDGSSRIGGKEITRNGEATDGDVIVRSPIIERDVKTDVVVCRGGVTYFGKEANMTCDTATIYRKEKRALLEGNVNMLVKPKDQQKLEPVELEPLRPIVPESIAGQRGQGDSQKKQDDVLRSGENRRKYPTRVLARRIEYWYGKGNRHAVISGDPQARQDLTASPDLPNGGWRQMFASEGFYNGENDTLKMVGSAGHRVRYRASNGDALNFEWITVSTKEDDDSYESGAFDGELGIEDEDLNNAKGNPPKP